MSTKGSLILTNDNEHWYEETSQPQVDNNGEFCGFDVVIEIDKKNIIDIVNDSENVIVTINGNTELAKILAFRLRSNRWQKVS